MASSVLDSSEEKTNGSKLRILIFDGGTEALRNVFENAHPGTDLHTVLSTHYSTLYHLFNVRPKIITQSQWDKLHPHPPKIPNIKEFDITLLVILLRNICSLSPPSTGWDVMPGPSDNTLEANIVRVKLFRNIYAHPQETGVSQSKFRAHWNQISSALVGLGFDRAEIEKLEKEGTLSEYLHWCDFKNEIQSLVEGYTEGTREWIFQQVEEWLNSSSDNRAFIISAEAGMGKSTIAAVACKRFLEQFAGCHFFQYNNSRYNKPTFLLESLAFHLCNAFPEYKKNLCKKLSGKKNETFEEMNIEGIFSMLFKEPLTDIPDPGKNFLIVIDALDESRQEERMELVDLIAKHFHKFPKFIRFLITTRHENDIARKFDQLKPTVLEQWDEKNLCDLRLFFDDKLKTVIVEDFARSELVENLVQKSEGLMLYASFVCKISEFHSIKSNLESLPKGIDQIYESYFNRFEKELALLGVDEDKFLMFLSVVAVAEGPLPIAVIETFFRSSEDDSPKVERTVQKTLSCISSLLVVKDKCVSFFHKSVKDWLAKPNHSFSIIEKCGHKILAEICQNEMETFTKNEVISTFDSSIKYVLKCGTSHILQVDLKEVQFLTKFVDYVTDVEILHASVCIDVYTTLANLSSLESHIVKNSLCTEMHKTINELIFIIRKFLDILKDTPQSFLQHVLNESNDERLSSRASDLLKTRYKELAYFEAEESRKSDPENPVINKLHCGKNLMYSFDVSPREDFLICVYRESSISVEIELFSIPNFEPIWKRSIAIEFAFLKPRAREPTGFQRPKIVFHPAKNIIFPGKLDSVLTLEGKFVSGPFTGEKSFVGNFVDCCFSNDKNKMVTNHGEKLIVWNLLDDNRENVIARSSCRSELFSILFSANDRFLATASLHELCIYDAAEKYSILSESSLFPSTSLISTFDSDSWIMRQYTTRDKYFVINYDLKEKQTLDWAGWNPHFTPLNTRAAREYEAAAKGKSSTLFENAKDYTGTFFILQNGNALVWCSFKKYLNLVRPAKINDFDPIVSLSELFIDSSYSISVDGKYIYKRSKYNSWQISMLSGTSAESGICEVSDPVKTDISFIIPVKNGTFVLLNRVCELWSFDMTQHLVSFPELAGTLRCLSVADDLVACVMESQVCFFNVLKKEIVARVPLSKSSLAEFGDIGDVDIPRSVITGSSLYHVVCGPFLLQDKSIVDLRAHSQCRLFFSSPLTFNACFSSNGRFLAFSKIFLHAIILFEIYEPKSYREFQVSLRNTFGRPELKFLDEKHLLYTEQLPSRLYLVDVETCDTLTCIELIALNSSNFFNPVKFCACRETRTIVCYSKVADEPRILKLWLPRQRDMRK